MDQNGPTKLNITDASHKFVHWIIKISIKSEAKLPQYINYSSSSSSNIILSKKDAILPNSVEAIKQSLKRHLQNWS